MQILQELGNYIASGLYMPYMRSFSLKWSKVSSNPHLCQLLNTGEDECLPGVLPLLSDGFWGICDI